MLSSPSVPDPSRPELPQAADPNRTDLNLHGPVSPDAMHVWWGTGTTRTFSLTGPGADTGNPELRHGGMTIDLRTPSAFGLRQHSPGGQTTAQESPGRYLVGGEIGRGGMGVVLEGWDAQLERAIAIKVLLEEHKGKPEVVRRFLEEARITSRLQHPGIVAIHELGTSPDGRPFFVMRLVRGQTLEQILGRREDASTDLPRLLNIFLQICQALAYAHSQGVIHRDLKPANVMVGGFGVVKVMDWGLAKVLGEPDLPGAVAAARAAAELSTRLGRHRPAPADPALPGTMVGTVFGTPAYLPPEQARGEIDRVDKRADVFGLGSILCEILTGRPPYTGVDGREVYEKAAGADIADAVARLNACPAPLDLITLAKWCLSPAHFDRPADAGDLVEVMTAHLHTNQRRAEQDLIRFFDLSMDLFCIASPDGYFIRVNENFPRVLGYTADDLTSHPFIAFVHPDDREKTEAELARIVSGEPCLQFLNRYRHARGHYLWLEWSAQTIPEERAVYAVARDVTERVEQAEAHRRAEQARFHLAAVVDSAEVAIVSTSLDGIIESWNPGAEHLFGYRAEEIIGRSVLLLVLPGREGDETDILTRLTHCERVQYYESVRRRKDGTPVHVSVTLSPVKDDAGNVVGASEIARNISARKKTELALLESEARLRAVLDHTTEAVISIDPAGTIESLNRSAEEMFGYAEGELLGRNIRTLMPPPYRDRHDGYLAEYMRTGVRKIIGRTVELVGRRKDAAVFPMELSVSEIRVADRRLFTGVIRDISTRQKSEAVAAEQVRAAAFISAAGAALTRGAGVREAMQDCMELAVSHLGVAFARVWTLNEPDGMLELQASAGMYTHLDGPHSRVPVGKYKLGLIARDRKPYLTNAVVGDPLVTDQVWAIREGMVAFAGHPLVVGDRVVGVLAVFARHPISNNILDTLHTVSDNLALGIRRQQLEDEVRDLRETYVVTG
ncbi:MAG: Serine/threonine protein kinase [Gemmataceae bacterium]|nr:Serine/threonine protein kinase [Gemmataceae bacterium]